MLPSPSNCVTCSVIKGYVTIALDHQHQEDLSSSSDANSIFLQQPLKLAELEANEVKQVNPEERFEIDQLANVIHQLCMEADRLS
jgi:hypothetical protein